MAMRKLLAVLMLAAFSISLAGCATLGQSSRERSHRISEVHEKNWKMAVEDWDRFWLIEEPSRLSPRNL